MAGAGDDGWGASAAFLDYDLDGDLDIFVVNYIDWSLEREVSASITWIVPTTARQAIRTRTPDVLSQRRGWDVHGRLDRRGHRRRRGQRAGRGLGGLRRFGHPGIFVANDGNPNHLFLGRGDGTRRRRSPQGLPRRGRQHAGRHGGRHRRSRRGRGSRHPHRGPAQPVRHLLPQDGYFVDDTAGTKLAAVTRRTTRFGVGLIDVDNDSRLDLYEASGRVMVRKDVARRGIRSRRTAS